jgi:hypothetical protein
MINRPAAPRIMEYLTIIRSISSDLPFHLDLGKKIIALQEKTL